MKNIIDSRITRDMKYLALYWALGFIEEEPDVFVKDYADTICRIYALEGKATYFSGVSVVGGDSLFLNSHKSFVVIECVDRLLELGYKPSSITIDVENEFDVYCQNAYIRCVEWGQKMEKDSLPIPKKKGTYLSILYSSRLYSGLIDRKEIILNGDGDTYDRGFFESRAGEVRLSVLPAPRKANGFEIQGDEAVSYFGKEKVAVLPGGVRKICSGIFWDNQEIEEVICPDSLEEIGGDLFYNCHNLKRFTIGRNVRVMGDNPFAGCPNLILKCESPYFNYKDGVLISKKDSVIYCDPRKEGEYAIPDGVKLIGKHAFYRCEKLTLIHIPSSLIHIKNFPFSGCISLHLDNHSPAYEVDGPVIYSSKNEVVGCLCSAEADELKIKEGTKRICRNSFFSCKGIRKIVFPKSLEDVGYNPFVQCGDVEFESKSPNFVVEKGILFNKDKTKIICCPRNKAAWDFMMPESVNALERGAFSGCDKMTSIDLKNVSSIGKSCFTNCASLKRAFIPDWVTYVGEWAFAHCSSLKEISVYKDTYLDKNIAENTPAKIVTRKSRSNWLIESENLYSLKGWQDAYKGKVDSILIDPPYNSDIPYIGYKDAGFNGGWASFMRERLLLAKNLLSERGFLIINIDEGEKDELEKLCVSIFGRELVTVHCWKKIHPYFDANRVVLNPNKKQTTYEYIIICRNSDEAVFGKIKQPYIEEASLKERWADFPETFDCFGTTSSAKDEMKDIFGDRAYFSTPKPVKLMEELARATTKKDSIVADFFAGSGTVGEAVYALNADDGGNRTFLLVSNSESDICRKVTSKRLELRDVPYAFE